MHSQPQYQITALSSRVEPSPKVNQHPASVTPSQQLPQMSVHGPTVPLALPHFDRYKDSRVDLPPLHHLVEPSASTANTRSGDEYVRKRKAAETESKHLSAGSLSSLHSGQASRIGSISNHSPSPQIAQQHMSAGRPIVAASSPRPPPGLTSFSTRGQSPYQRSPASYSSSPKLLALHAEHRPPPLPTSGSQLSQSMPTPAYHSLLHQEQSNSSAGTSSSFVSGSGSPMRPYSPYDQDDRRSPAIARPAVYMSSGVPIDRILDRNDPSSTANTLTRTGDGSYAQSIPVTTHGENSAYRLITISTPDGPRQVPCDVQAGSRGADEKRKRNAGASARFRQRRKEKEVEASDKIRNLDKQVHELSEDLAFYRQERDQLVNALMQIPGADRNFPRPPSPRHRRGPTSVGASGDLDYDFVHEGPDGRDEGRNVRRRTTSFGSTAPLARTPITAAPPLLPAQHASAQASRLIYAGPNAEHPSMATCAPLRPAHSPSMVQTGQLPPLRSLTLPASGHSPTSGPHNPFTGPGVHRLDQPPQYGPGQLGRHR